MVTNQHTDVLMHFLIPFGFGIPSGILKAQDYHLHWAMILFLYFISDLILALVFEPILILILHFGRNNLRMQRFGALFKQALIQTTEKIGTGTGPFALILFTFGSDPMTGRSIAVAAGHSWITGWIIAITGDMLYFAVLMASTLWLNSLLGDGKWTASIILVAMVAIPMLIKSYKNRSR